MLNLDEGTARQMFKKFEITNFPGLSKKINDQKWDCETHEKNDDHDDDNVTLMRLKDDIFVCSFVYGQVQPFHNLVTSKLLQHVWPIALVHVEGSFKEKMSSEEDNGCFHRQLCEL